MNLNENAIKIKGQMRAILHSAKTGEIVKDTGWVDNVVPDVARIAIAKLLCGVSVIANPCEITYCAVGTGTTAPNVLDTILETEIDRVPISGASANNGTEAQIRAFFTTTQGNGVLKELGLFGEDASVTIDTGTLFQRVAIDFEKTTGETLTILSKIPINYS